MTTEIVLTTTNTIVDTERLALAGQVANRVAADNVFGDYLSRKASNTVDAQRADLQTFADCLGAAGVVVAANDLQTAPAAWQGVTWGMVEGFVKWMLGQGFAVASVNRKLSPVKAYIKLANKSGVISTDEYIRIRAISGYGGKEAKRVNERRDVTRIGVKKETHTSITDEQAQVLKSQPDTPQGRRDALLMCLLLDHGLRCGEVAQLQVTHFDLKKGVMTFYRPKVDKQQNHKLSADTLRSLRAYFDAGDCPAMGALLRGSRRGGNLTDAGMSETAITERVRSLGASIGVNGLSAHDCRHYWATRWAGKVDVFRLQEAGGWNSLAMPRRYVEHAKIANDGMV